MTNKIILPNGFEAVEATYSELPIEEYNCNPYIQALPPLENTPAIIKKLMMNPTFREEERNLDSVIRLHIVQRLYQFFQPLPIHVRIWNTIHTLIMQGYLARNPFDKDYKQYVNQTGKQIIRRAYDINGRANFRTTASCGTIIGISGMGKTTTVNRILNQIPQVIVHNEYRGQHFSQFQLSWLKLEAPHNSSLKALCLQYFMKIDELLGTNTFKKYISRNLSVDAMVPLMGQVAQNVALGMLIIDEVQHLRNRGAEQMMNFFVSIINSFGLPLLIIGTPASYSIFENEFRISRRVTGNGEIIYNNMGQDNEFRLFLEGIWKYQWNRKYTPLNEEFVQVFYEETQGISDLIVKLFVNAQSTAILSGKEQLSIGVVKKTAREHFKLMRKMLDAIKSGNPYKIARYEDIRKIEVNDTKVQRKQAQSTNVTKIEKVEKPMNKNVSIASTKKTASEYADDDLRVLFNEASRGEKTPYQLLLEHGYIDDMALWEERDRI